MANYAFLELEKAIAAAGMLPSEEVLERFARRDDSHWEAARSLLVDTHRIASSVVEKVCREGGVFANDLKPNPCVVFAHRDVHGEIKGATLMELGRKAPTPVRIGASETAWFAVGNLAEAHSVVALESPIEALSYFSLHGDAREGCATVSCGGTQVPHELMWNSYERRQRFVVALGNTQLGERGWQSAWDGTVDWTGFNLSSTCPRNPSWNADLRALRQSQGERLCVAESPGSTFEDGRAFIYGAVYQSASGHPDSLASSFRFNCYTPASPSAPNDAYVMDCWVCDVFGRKDPSLSVSPIPVRKDDLGKIVNTISHGQKV